MGTHPLAKTYTEQRMVAEHLSTKIKETLPEKTPENIDLVRETAVTLRGLLERGVQLGDLASHPDLQKQEWYHVTARLAAESLADNSKDEDDALHILDHLVLILGS